MTKKKIVPKIKLDIGCGPAKQQGFVGMDVRDVKGVDIVHDAEIFPYPLDDNSCDMISMSHVIEHIKPWLQIQIMDECWRLLEPEGMLFISTPYAGNFRWLQDPTHCASWSENTPLYYTPKDQLGNDSILYKVYTPQPWKIEQLRYSKYMDVNVAFRKLGE